MKDRRLAQTFGIEAQAYERGRPGYPDDAVEWLLGRAATDGGALPDVVDLGAGTGKLTRSLLGRAASVTAVEPDAGMRAMLGEALPSAEVREGSAERIPVEDAGADVVTMAQAWHWVDPVTASAEVARVLRAGGVLALVWNVRDEEVPWVAALTAIIGGSIAEQFDTVTPPVAEPLVRDAYAEFRWSYPLDRAGLRDLVASRSAVIALEPAERDALLARVDELAATHPDLAGRERFELPYATRVTIARVG